MNQYEPAINVDALIALDMHVRIETDESGHASLPDDIRNAANTYFKVETPALNLDNVAQYYRDRRTSLEIAGYPKEVPASTVKTPAARDCRGSDAQQ